MPWKFLPSTSASKSAAIDLPSPVQFWKNCTLRSSETMTAEQTGRNSADDLLHVVHLHVVHLFVLFFKRGYSFL